MFDACIEGIANGTVPKSTFDEEAAKVYAYGENAEEGYGGFYFCPGNAYTTEFSKAFPEVVEKARSLSVGEVGKVEYTAEDSTDSNNGFVGKVYILRTENEAGAYTDTSSPFFADFYKIASYALTLRMADEKMAEAELRSKWEKINIITHKYTSYYGVS